MSLLNPTLSGLPAGSRAPFAALSAFAGVAAAHAVLLILLIAFVPVDRIAEIVRPLAVRIVELAPEAPPPPVAPPRPRVTPKPQPPAPIIAVAAPQPAPATASFTVPPQPAPPAIAPAPVAPAPPAPVTPARFDAAYLNNPSPVYPAISRRLGEEGKVVLRVQVTPEGRAADIETRTSSGFPRLDEAARNTVGQWRFVPARQGDIPVTAWVVVPIVFRLEG